MKPTHTLEELRATISSHPIMRSALEHIPGYETVQWSDLAEAVMADVGLNGRSALATTIRNSFFHYESREVLHDALGLERNGTTGCTWRKPIEFRKMVCE